MSSEHPQVTLRPVEDGDLEFLRYLYATTREQEMALVPWSAGEKEAFLTQQFEAQHAFYTERFAGAEFSLVLVDGVPAGRLYVDRRDDEIRLIDIALTPEHRGRGIGGRLLRELLHEAGERQLPVRIHVERNNPALRLYRRLGFEPVDDNGIYHLMEWRPGAAGGSGEGVS